MNLKMTNHNRIHYRELEQISVVSFFAQTKDQGHTNDLSKDVVRVEEVTTKGCHVPSVIIVTSRRHRGDGGGPHQSIISRRSFCEELLNANGRGLSFTKIVRSGCTVMALKSHWVTRCRHGKIVPDAESRLLPPLLQEGFRQIDTGLHHRREIQTTRI